MAYFSKEIWKDIKGYDDYFVSNTGKVKSCKYGKERILKQNVERGGYLHVSLSNNGKVRNEKVHQLVAFAFPEICGEWFEGAEINHKDENPANNNANNLEFLTHQENNVYGNKTQRMLSNRKCKNKCKPVIQFTMSGEEINRYSSASEAARQLGCSNIYISMCCRGICKTAYGYKWNYNNY